MHRILLWTIIGLLLSTAAAAAQKIIEQDKCECLNEGKCTISKTGKQYCLCPSNILDTNCNIQSQQLNEKEVIANLTEQFSYYYVTFNSTTLYFVSFIFCPTVIAQNSLISVHIQLQGDNGSLEQNPPHEDLHTFEPAVDQCVSVKFILLAFKVKQNGEYARLVLRLKTAKQDKQTVNLKQNQKINEKEIESASSAQIKLSSIKYQFYEMPNIKITQFLAISTLSCIFAFTITLVICRWLMIQRMRRFRYHPATVINSISHFDTTMPSSYYIAELHPQDQQKMCMICLLDIDKTQIRYTPCKHLFHKDCIDQWGKIKLICPTCRASLKKQQTINNTQSILDVQLNVVD